MLSLEYISLSLAGFIENIMSSIASTSVSDFMLDAILATHPGTSDEALGFGFSELEKFMSADQKDKNASNELRKHIVTFAKSLYQLCVYLATLIIIGGKFAFDAMYEGVVKPTNKEQS